MLANSAGGDKAPQCGAVDTTTTTTTLIRGPHSFTLAYQLLFFFSLPSHHPLFLFSFLFFLFAFFHFFPFPFFILGLSLCNLRYFNFSVILSCSFSREIFTATAKSVPAFYKECRLRVCTSFFFLVRRDWRVENSRDERRLLSLFTCVLLFYLYRENDFFLDLILLFIRIKQHNFILNILFHKIKYKLKD